MDPTEPWPADEATLVTLQEELAAVAAQLRDDDPWVPAGQPPVAGCFLAYAPGEAGPGRAGDHAWAAVVVWRPGSGSARSVDEGLRGVRASNGPRRSTDTLDQVVVAGRVGHRYVPGLLALREGPLLADALAGLDVCPDVVLVDATGVDHPRRAGLAVHLGAATGLPTVGVTHRALVASVTEPGPERGSTAPVTLEGTVVARSVRTRTGARPVIAHAGWRTDPETAADVVLLASTEAARTPAPLQEARRVAREARARS